MPGLQLVGFTVENLRGFSKAHIGLERQVTLLVGPNNSGKTSLLRLLEWSLTGVDLDLLEGRRGRRPTEDALLLPARNSQARARRLTLHVRIEDGRRRKKFHAKNGISLLRLRIVGEGAYAAVTPPRRSETKQSEKAAIDLWSELHEDAVVVHVPAARDASSDRFKATLSVAIRARLEERALHDVRGGAPAEYRALKGAAEKISDVGDGLVAPLWHDMSERLPSGIVSAGTISFAASPTNLVEWLVEQAEFRISTGSHDDRTVKPHEVGSGLQSLLDLALLESVESLMPSSWLLLEEPEAFLHPSAQRQLASNVLADRSVRRVISTHSPIVVDEAEYGQVVLLRNHSVFEPAERNTKREEINSALMAGSGAEAMFAESVLFVEGPGDRTFFDALRRRVAAHDKSGATHQLGLVAVGGCTRFSPWINLMQSYADRQGDLPIEWLAVADSVDATSDLARGMRDGGITIPQQLSDSLRATAKAYSEQGTGAGITHTNQVNTLAASHRTRLHLLPVDLEYCMVKAMSDATAAQLSARLGTNSGSAAELMRKLGSKLDGKASANCAKDEWMRAEIGRCIPWTQVSEEVRVVMVRWLEGVMEGAAARDLVDTIRD